MKLIKRPAPSTCQRIRVDLHKCKPGKVYALAKVDWAKVDCGSDPEDYGHDLVPRLCCERIHGEEITLFMTELGTGAVTNWVDISPGARTFYECQYIELPDYEVCSG